MLSNQDSRQGRREDVVGEAPAGEAAAEARQRASGGLSAARRAGARAPQRTSSRLTGGEILNYNRQ
ncbi:MAG: hypothetical protein JWL97_3069 [Gemmatimonadales bacterium]|nr:hypothetical protein [Gemmatimonadales bacterium]